MDAWNALRRHGNVVFAAILCIALQFVVWTDSQFAGDRFVNASAALVFGGSLFLRGRTPVVPLGVGAALLAVPTFNALANSGVLAIGIIACLYSCGSHAERLIRRVGLAIGLAAIPLSIATSTGGFSPNDTLWVTLIVLAPWAAGRLVLGMRDRARLLERHNLRLDTEQEMTAARATAEERIRIARELHDVIAHTLSLIVVQARGGRRMVHRGRQADTLEAFDTVEHAAQRALDEMRRLLGLLREDEDAHALAPPPSLARLPDLIDELAEAGFHADLVIEGEPHDLPAGVEVSAYRIVQEALTNALRHSGSSRARVLLTYASDRLELEVLDEGQGAIGTVTSGHGLIGIRERVAIYGGELHAGTRPDGGYALKARLPLWVSE